LASVASTTSKAVSAAISGGGSRRPTSSAATKAATAAPVSRAPRDNTDRQRVRSRQPARDILLRAALRSPPQTPYARTPRHPIPCCFTVSPPQSGPPAVGSRESHGFPAVGSYVSRVVGL